MSNWKIKKIKDFAFTASGGTPSTERKDYWFEGTIPWINSGELSKHDVIRKPTTYITQEALENSSAKLFPIGTVVIALTGATTGMSAILEIETSTNQSITGIFPSKEHDSKFLLYTLQHKIDKILLHNVGSAQPHINKEIVDNLEFNYPDVSEQSTISTILSTCVAVIEKTQSAIAKYKAIKNGMLHDLFTRGIDIQTGKLRPRYEDAPELYKDSKLGWIPREWEETPLENLCIGKPSYGINAPAVEFSYQLPTYLRITDIDDEGKFIKDGRKSVDSPSSGDYILNDGDLVFARTGATVGKTYLYNTNDGVLVYAGFLIKVSPNNSSLNSKYLKSFTETSYYKNWVELMSQRSAQPGINGNEYGKQLIPKPEIKEQEIIAERIITIDNKLQTEQSYLQKMQKLKKGLIEDLLSGSKRVKV